MNKIIRCRKCDQPKTFKNQNSYNANKKKNSICIKCKHKEHSNKLRGKKRMPFSDQWKRNLAIGHKNSDVWKKSMNTPEYKEKHRRKMIKLIKQNKSKVGYNPKACEVFEFINGCLQWSGLHAQNGKEQSIDVFFLDYYEPTLNLAIEWDEKDHKKPSRQKRDWMKQKIVTETLGCEFYRVDDTTKQVRKVDKNPTDRTREIQTALNEYYENKK